MSTRARTANTKLGIFAAQLALAAGLVVATGSGAQALGVGDECGRRPGFLVFIDRGGNMTRGHCAGVEGTNPYWGDFGWANRADEFRNDGNTHNACIFEFGNFNREHFFPDSRLLRKNEVVVWYDEVESNAWTQGDGC